MTEIKIQLSTNNSHLKIHMPEVAEFSAEQLECFIRNLGLLRANMQPKMPDIDLTSESVVSVVPCNRWCTDWDKNAPTQIRLYLQHLGFGWVWISLNEKAVGELTAGLQFALQQRPKLA